MAEPMKVEYLAIEDSVKGIRDDGETRSPVLIADPDTGNTIIRALDAGGSVLFQDATGDPLGFAWADISGKPTTISGYGITDAYTESEVDALLAGKSSTGHTHTFASLTSKPTTLSGFGITDGLTQAAADLLYLALAGGTLTGALAAPSFASSGPLAAATYLELTGVSTPSNPATDKARIFFDTSAVKAVLDDGSIITLGTIGGAITDAYAVIAGNSGTASASGGATLSVVGSGGISTTAADGAPDTLTIALGNHSASLLTSGTIPDGRVPASAVTQHQAALSIGFSQLTGNPSFVGARATLTADQSIPNSTYTALSLTGETFDSHAYHSTATNPSRFTIPTGKAGKYRFSGMFGFAVSASGNLRIVAIHKNGTAVLRVDRAPLTTATTAVCQWDVILDLAVGDYLEVFAFQDSGGALNVTGGTVQGAYAELTYLGA